MKRLVLLLLAALPLCARAQENAFSVDADYLTRGEIRRGGISVEEDGDALHSRFILSRTRLGATYSRDWLTARLTAQHADTWGSAAGNALSMNEAWVKAQFPVGLFAQLGRQRLSYDDQRIFGADDWSMTGYSHDGLKLGFERAGHKVHLFGAYNQNVDNIDQGGTRFSGGIQPYKSLASLWYHYDIPKTNIGASLLFVNMGLEYIDFKEDAYATCFQQLAGTFLSWTPKHFGLEASYYHQWGKANGNIPLNAWMASAKATATPSEHWSFRAGYDYLSGEEDFPIPGGGNIGLVRHEIVRGFNSLYGSNHARPPESLCRHFVESGQALVGGCRHPFLLHGRPGPGCQESPGTRDGVGGDLDHRPFRIAQRRLFIHAGHRDHVYPQTKHRQQPAALGLADAERDPDLLQDQMGN